MSRADGERRNKTRQDKVWEEGKNSQVKVSPPFPPLQFAPLLDNIILPPPPPSIADDSLEMLVSMARCWRYSIATRATPPRVIWGALKNEAEAEYSDDEKDDDDNKVEDDNDNNTPNNHKLNKFY